MFDAKEIPGIILIKPNRSITITKKKQSIQLPFFLQTQVFWLLITSDISHLP
jgi:hypothetical protein